MKVFWITGCIGAGKSEVCRIAQSMGIPVFDSDSIAKKWMENNPEARRTLTDKFGQQLYREERLNREWLSDILFNDAESRKFVETIVHRAVHNAFEEWNSVQTSAVVIRESAPLLSIDLSQQTDTIILVSCVEEKRIERVLQRPGMNAAKFLERSRLQHAEAIIRPFADFEIINDGRALLPQVLKVLGS